MSGLLQVRDVPDDVRRTLKARAAAGGESLNSYLLALLARDAERPTVEQVLRRAEQRAERAGVSSLTAVEEARSELAFDAAGGPSTVGPP